MKNKKMHVGVLAGLMSVPVASVVTVSASDNITAEELKHIDVTQQAVNVSSMMVAATTPTPDASTINPADWRLQELLKFNESTAFGSITNYEEILNTLALDTNDTVEGSLHAVLKAKISYLAKLDRLKKEAAQLNRELSLLKPTNGDTIQATKNFEARHKKLEADFKMNRDELDAVIEVHKSNLSSTTYLTDAIGHMKLYQGTLETYIASQIPSLATLQKFVADIVEPERFTSGDTITVQLGTKAVDINFPAFLNLVPDSDTNRTEFREQYEAIRLYLDSKVLADSKKIIESHLLANGKTIAQVLKVVGDDITSADKVNGLIEAMDNTEFKSESTFLSKVKAITTAYNKLSDRGKMLVPTYATEVEKQTSGGVSTGYSAAEEVISAIKALKPAGTQEFRDAARAASADVATVHTDYQKYIINAPKLTEYLAAITKAEEVEALINALDTAGTEASDITTAREKYKALTSAERKVVLKDVYAKLQAWEKTAKDSVKVNTTITKIKIENKKTFATNVEKAEKQFDSLGSVPQQELVDFRERLKLISPLAKITGQYYALKLSNKPEYRTAVRSVYDALKDNKAALTKVPVTTYDTIDVDISALERLYAELWAAVEPKVLVELDPAEAVEDIIDTAQSESGTAQVTAILSARTAYDNLSKNAQKIVDNYKTLTALEKTVKTPVKVAQQIEAVSPSSTKFESAAKSATKAFEKLNSAQKEFIEMDIQNMVKDYNHMLNFITQMKAIKVSNPGYRAQVEKAKTRLAELKGNTVFDSSKKDELKDSLLKYEDQIKAFEQGIGRGDLVVKLITELASLAGEAFIKGVERVESEYAQLSASDKKLVTNYKVFQTLKKDSEKAAKVIDLINHPTIMNKDVTNSSFTKAMKSATAGYEKLTSVQRAYVYNYSSRVQPLLKIYELALIVEKIKPNSKTFREDVNAARTYYDGLTANEKTVALPLLQKIEGSEGGITEVQKVIELINEAVPGVENYVEKLKIAREAYDKLAAINSAYPKLVTNYKQLQNREKLMAPVTSSIYEIKELELLIDRPFNDPTDFVKKYQAAMKAYEKIPFESRQLVTNREILLKVIYPVASTLEAIMNISETSKTFGADVLRAREMYDQLSDSDKALISNYKKLVDFEVVVAGGSVIDEMIRQIPTYSGTSYTQAIKEARAAYDQLTPAEKRAVALYSQLQAYEKGVQSVLTAIDLIDALQFSSNLVTAYDKAMKALDKLTSDQRQMVGNLYKLTAVAPAIEVFKMIENLKPGAEGYAGSVQAAYAAYNRLSTSEKQYVTNFAQLQESKNNIDTLNAVIAKIKEIEPGSRNYGAQVQEALALYNSLPASVKKLVTNYDVLKTSQSEVAAVENVRSLIAEIDNEAASFAEKVLAARAAYDQLTTTQKRLVSNYFMLEDYEKELGTMF